MPPYSPRRKKGTARISRYLRIRRPSPFRSVLRGTAPLRVAPLALTVLPEIKIILFPIPSDCNFPQRDFRLQGARQSHTQMVGGQSGDRARKKLLAPRIVVSIAGAAGFAWHSGFLGRFNPSESECEST